METIRQTVNRAKQVVEETFGNPTTTPYDLETMKVLKLAEDLRYHKELLSAAYAYIQPDPALRLLPTLTGDGLNKQEVIAKEFGELGKRLNGVSDYSADLLHTADTYDAIGRAHRDYLSKQHTRFLLPAQRTLQEEQFPIEKEAVILATRRMELDAVKNNTAGNEGYVQPPELEKAQREFDNQQERVKQAGAELNNRVQQLRDALKNFIDEELEYHNKVQEALSGLRKQIK